MPGIDLTDRHNELLSHWRSLIAEGEDVPKRQAFDPVNVPRLLSFLILVEITEDDAIFRVVGTEMVAAWGGDFTGKRMSEIMKGDYRDYIHRLFRTCVENRAPILSQSRFQWDKGRYADTIRLMLPFSKNDDPSVVGYVLVGQSFDYSRAGPDRPEAAKLTGGKFEEVSLSVL